ncbi:DUF2877 domain-containing protein [Herminiimonas glaciei]|uniref:DUF2877 domain-containing protein n=1 Tax=Herminiimonas glaciei TaxID=523788 RepID=A0ABW2IAQ1_9BURK
MRALRVRALSADADFMSRLKQGDFQLRMHSRFSRVVNLRCSQSGLLYSVVSSALDDAPNTLRIGLSEFDTLPLGEDAELSLSGGMLRLGKVLEIELDACGEWLPPPVVFRAFPPEYFLNISSRIQDEKFANNSISFFEYDGNDVFYQAMSQHLVRGSTRLMEGMRTAHEPQIRKGLTELLGLGIGLTPSGDDYIVGLCAVLALPQHPAHGYMRLIAEVIRDGKSRTNTISYMALIKAVEGKTRASIGALLATIFNGELSLLKERIKPVLNIGSSSGADILSGITAGLLLSNHLGSPHAA